MRARLNRWVLITAAAVFPAALASAQTAPVAAPAPVPLAQPPAAAPAEAPPPVYVPPPLWTVPDAHQLLFAIQAIGQDGLTPADYDPQGLVAAMSSGDPLKMSAAATERFKRLASDLALGHVRGDDRKGWKIPDKDLEGERLDLLLRTALAQHRIPDALRGLHPTHPQYSALKQALAITDPSDSKKVNRIRLNMDRWRWLPRDLGERYIIVNVPAYYVALVEKGETQWRQKAIAGAVKTPTPMITAMASGVILNPWWEIPKSIEKEVRGKRGYVAVKNDKGKIIRWRQPPGPSNALGQMKFVMPNDEAIFLHDTNARSRFNADIRSLSHGCIRTQNIVDLAKVLLAEGETEWTPEKVDEALEAKKTVQANFAEPLPVYIVYFSSAAALDGRIVDYKDIYKHDGPVLEALLDATPKTPAAEEQVASR